jgi:hypothetical protein
VLIKEGKTASRFFHCQILTVFKNGVYQSCGTELVLLLLDRAGAVLLNTAGAVLLDTPGAVLLDTAGAVLLDTAGAVLLETAGAVLLPFSATN